MTSESTKADQHSPDRSEKAYYAVPEWLLKPRVWDAAINSTFTADLAVSMPAPIPVPFAGQRYKSYLLYFNLFLFPVCGARFTEELKLYRATKFESFDKGIRLRLAKKKTPGEIEQCREPRDVLAKIRFSYNGPGWFGTGRSVIVTEDNWDDIMDAILKGEGGRFSAEYVVRSKGGWTLPK